MVFAVKCKLSGRDRSKTNMMLNKLQQTVGLEPGTSDARAVVSISSAQNRLNNVDTQHIEMVAKMSSWAHARRPSTVGTTRTLTGYPSLCHSTRRRDCHLLHGHWNQTFSVALPLCEDVPKEGWVTSSKASSGRTPRTSKESTRALSLHTKRRRFWGIAGDHSLAWRAVKMWDGQYLYAFNWSEETCAPLNQTAFTPGRALTEFGKISSRRQHCGTTRRTREVTYRENHEPGVLMSGVGR